MSVNESRSVALGCERDLNVDSLNTNTTGVLRIGQSSSWYGLGTTAERVGVKFMFNSTATSGTAWGQQIRMRVGATGGSSVGLNVSASSTALVNAANLTAIQGYSQPGAALSAAGGIACALYGCSQNPVATDIVGRSWTLWVDTHCTVTAGAGQYLARFSHNGTATTDGCFTFYIGGRMTYFMNFEDVSGFLTTTSGTLTATHKALVKLAGVTGPTYMVFGTVA